MTCRILRRRLAAKAPVSLTAYPFEAATGMIGAFASLPILLNVGTTRNVYHGFPEWVPYVWVALFFIGGVRTLFGLWHNNRRCMAAGSSTVSWMVLVLGLASLYRTGGDAGWTTIIIGVSLVFVAMNRSLHLRAVAAELRRAR